MATLYRIANWDEIFENAASRKIGQLRWVAMPNKHDSDGYLFLVDHPNGAAHYGAWAALVQVASKCQPRGSLLGGDSQPYGIAQIARKTSLPVEIFEEVVPRLIDPLGWLIAEDTEQTQSESPQRDTDTLPADYQPSGSALPDNYHPCGTEGKGREGDGRGQNGIEQKNHGANGSSAKLTGILESTLSDEAGMVGLHARAIRLGIISRSQHDQLNFWGAAVHALRGDDPPALFSWLVHGGHWDHVTAAEEDEARRRLKAMENGR